MKTGQEISASPTTTLEDPAYFEHHAKEQSKSGISRAAYCRMHHVNYDRLSYWIKNKEVNRSKSKANVVPIKIKSDIFHEVNGEGSKTLCTMRFKNGVTLLIHEREILSLVLKEMA
jgi:hypothetical protein